NCKSPIGNTAVTWSVVSGSATLFNTISTSDGQGRVSTGVQLGQNPGGVVIRVAIGNVASADFNITNQVVGASISVTSGNNQTVNTGQNFPQPVVFTVKDINGSPVAGVTVTFAVVSGSGGVNPTSAVTTALGQASTTVSAGVPAGQIVISGS